MRGARCLTYAHPHMRDLVLALFHLAVVPRTLWLRWCASGDGGESLLKQQLIVLRRVRKWARNLKASDRLLCGFWSMFVSAGRIRKIAVAC